MRLPNKHKGAVKATPEQECGGALLAHDLEGTETQGHSTETTGDWQQSKQPPVLTVSWRWHGCTLRGNTTVPGTDVDLERNTPSETV